MQAKLTHFISLTLILGVGCGVLAASCGGDEDRCAQAEEHIKSCLNEPSPALSDQCDPQAADKLLSLTCADLRGTPAGNGEGTEQLSMNANLAPPMYSGSPTLSVPRAPRQLFISKGQRAEFTYWGHTISINYLLYNPMQIVIIYVDGKGKGIVKRITDDPRGVYWNEGNLRFSLKPVVWEIREGTRIPFYETTWNTSVLSFTVF